MIDNNYPKGSIQDIRELIQGRMTDEKTRVILTKDVPDKTDDGRRKLIDAAH